MYSIKEKMEEFEQNKSTVINNSDNCRKKAEDYLLEDDPRPDLSDDTNYWRAVLTEAKKIDNQLHGNLHGFRCAGAKLELDDGQLQLIPDIGQDNWVWPDKQSYLRDRRKFLMPFKAEIKDIFEKVGKLIPFCHNQNSEGQEVSLSGGII